MSYFIPNGSEAFWLNGVNSDRATINDLKNNLAYIKSTKCDQAHALGITGKGVRIGSVDSGTPAAVRYNWATLESTWLAWGFATNAGFFDNNRLLNPSVGEEALPHVMTFKVQDGPPVTVSFDGTERAASDLNQVEAPVTDAPGFSQWPDFINFPATSVIQTLENMAAKINTAFLAAGQNGKAAVLVDRLYSWFGTAYYPRLIVYSAGNNTDTSKIELVTGTKHLLDILLMGHRDNAGNVIPQVVTGRPFAGADDEYPNVAYSKCRYAYNHPVLHPAVSRANYDFTAIDAHFDNMFTSAPHDTFWDDQVPLYAETIHRGLDSNQPHLKAFRESGATSVASTREFTPAPGGAYGLAMCRQVGIRPGDQLIITEGADAGTYTVVSVDWTNPGYTNAYSKLTIDRDWPTGGQSNVKYKWKLQDSRLPHYSLNNTHALWMSGMLCGNPDTGMRGVAPDATYIRPQFNNPGGVPRAIEFLIKANVEVASMLLGGLNDGVYGLGPITFQAVVAEAAKHGLLLTFQANNLENPDHDTQPNALQAFSGQQAMLCSATRIPGYRFSTASAANESFMNSWWTSGYGSIVDICTFGAADSQFLGTWQEGISVLQSRWFSLDYAQALKENGFDPKVPNMFANWSGGFNSWTVTLVAGGAALVIEALKNMPRNATKVQLVRSILKSTAASFIGYTPGLHGGGKMDCKAAVEAALLLRKGN